MSFSESLDIISDWVFILIITTIVMTGLYFWYNKKERTKKPKKSKYPDFEMNLRF
jgi:hypothetical protein